MEDYRARFVEIYNKNITRPGADRLLSCCLLYTSPLGE